MSINSESIDIDEALSYPTDYDDGKMDCPYKDEIEDEEEVGEAKSIKSTSEKLSDFMATSTIIKAILGFGFLSMPYIFKTLGIIPSLVLFGIVYYVETTSVSSLLRCKDITKK